MITVVIPTIPPRSHFLLRAMASVAIQSLSPAAVSVAVDLRREGAARTRQRALDAVRTPWVAFLDDDDEFKPEHLEKLAGWAAETAADYVYSWYDVIGGTDPRPESFGRLFDPAKPIQTTITTLVRTELAQAVGFRTVGNLESPDRMYAGEDWGFTRGCLERGAKISHLPERTWLWHHHGANTSGLPNRW